MHNHTGTGPNLVATDYNKVCIMKLYNHLDLPGIKLKSNVIDKGDKVYREIKSFADNIINDRYDGYKSAVNIEIWQIQLSVLRNVSYVKISNNEMKKANNKITLVNNVNIYLEKDFPRNVSLEAIAKHCGYAKYYFSHYFKNTTGIGFWEYYSVFRIKKWRLCLKILITQSRR